MGPGAQRSALCVFSEAAGEAAKLGETGPDHGLEHQVGGGRGRLGILTSGRLGPASPAPSGRGPGCGCLGSRSCRWLGLSRALPQGEGTEVHASPRPALYNILI